MKYVRIREARKTAGLTQEQLAKLLGINRATLSRYESGEIDPPLSQLNRIADTLNIPIEDLLGIDRENRVVTPTDKLLHFFDRLNETGQQKAIERIEELSEISRYRREFAPWE